MAKKPTLDDFLNWWLREIARYGRTEDHVELVEVKVDYGTTGVTGRDLSLLGAAGAIEERVHVCIYTDTNRFHINAVWRAKDDGYLGCTSEARRPRAGEDWHRGSDLADGPLTKGTWHRILADIVSYEMVKVHRNSIADLAHEREAANRLPIPVPARGQPDISPNTGPNEPFPA